MRKRIHLTAVAGLGVLLLSAGCATRGQLRTGLEAQAAELEEQRVALEQQRATLDAQRAALEAERSDRMAGDQRLAGELGGLDSDLASIRNDFDVRIAQLEEGLEFSVPVHFSFDAAEVRTEVRPTLDRFAEIVQRHYPDAMITVEGFADPAGPSAYNRQLSQKRAESVRDYLASLGIQPSRIRAVGYGEERLVVPGAAGTASGAELNRRVVFVVETPGVAVLGVPAPS
jgi:outer membrane protein OmpA-like peptidoglycan-associated protein